MNKFRILNNINPIVKIIFLILVYVLIFNINTSQQYFLAYLLLIILLLLSQVDYRKLFRLFLYATYIIVFYLLINVFLQQPGSVVFQFYFLKITSGQLESSVLIVRKLYLLFFAGSLVFLTTSLEDFISGLGVLLTPLKYLRINTKPFLTSIFVGYNFLPMARREYGKMKKIYLIKGINFQGRNLLINIKLYIGMLVPIFRSLFINGEDLVVSMLIRKYDPWEQSTDIYRRRLVLNDYVWSGVLLGSIILISMFA